MELAAREPSIMKRLAKGLFRRLGYEIRQLESRPQPVRDEVLGPLEQEALAAIPVVRQYTMLSPARLTTLYRQAVHCETTGVDGAFVECGVWKGGAVGMMALANLRHGSTRRPLHLFDAFQEICEPDAEMDGPRVVEEGRRLAGRDVAATGRLVPVKGIYDSFGGPGTIAACRGLLEGVIGYPASDTRYHEGWFQHTVPGAASEIGPIAILRLDGDLYHSVKVCLEHLYDRVSRRGFVVIDDYHQYEGCTRAVDEFRAARGIRAFLHHADYTMRPHAYWVKGEGST